MNKYKIMLIVILSFMFCLVPVFATEQVAPSPPSWVEEGEYLVFKNSSAYEPEMWKQICEIRAELEKTPDYSTREFQGIALKMQRVFSGYHEDAGCRFEKGLLYYKVFLNYGSRLEATYAKSCFLDAAELLEHGDNQKILYMWAVRSSLLHGYHTDRAVIKFLEYPDYNIYEVAANQNVVNWSGEYLEKVLATPVILLDGEIFDTEEVNPEITNGRVMLPIRNIVEAIGGKIEWNDKTKEVTITKSGDTLILTVGNTSAYRNNKKITLDVAPYIKDGRTFLPVRFVSEQLGQKVEWVGNPRIVIIKENKDAYVNSNLETWLKAMGAYLADNSDNKSPFVKTRYANHFTGYAVRDQKNAAEVKKLLESGWSIYDRDGLIYQIDTLTDYGHNSDFLFYVDLIDNLTKKEYEQLLKEVGGIDEYMFPLTKEISKKWGERGIMAWDLFRVSNLAQWGYVMGYLTYNEALEAAEPAVKKLQENFNSWEEAYDNYVDGHVWWSRTDVKGLDYEEWGRRPECMELMQKYKDLFDNNFFKEKNK